MRKHGKTDSNQREIVAALHKAGAFIQSLADVGDGCPDLITVYHGRVYLMEAKTEEGDLRPKQAKWIAECERIGGVAVHIVRSAEDALRVVGAI